MIGHVFTVKAILAAVILVAAAYLIVAGCIVAFLVIYGRRRRGSWKGGRADLRFALAAGRLWPRLLPALLQDLYDSNH